MALIELCNAADVEPGTALRVEAADRLLAVFNIDGAFYVTADACSHGPGSLSAGAIEGDVVECDFHGGCFHIPTGQPVKPPCTEPVPVFAVTLRDGKVWIELP
ncbi:MAG: non-heme iron oxygenase ferredoxin subunit [Proteobacteria bacterium]|nr:non-heme iron oxygenase ferredoxin subunit [Pseudomonadota bacterium]